MPLPGERLATGAARGGTGMNGGPSRSGTVRPAAATTREAVVTRSDDAGTAVRNPLSKALQLLEAMVDAGRAEYGLREIASMAEIVPSSAHRLLASLKRDGLVQQTPEGRYRLGLEFFRLAWRATTGFGVRGIALPVLEELARDCDETALLGLYDHDRREMMFAASVEANHPLRYVVQLHQWLPIHSGASGLAILAFLPEPERHAVVDAGSLTEETERTITDPAALHSELAKIRKRGYAVSVGQRILGAVGVAAPLWSSSGEVIGDVMVTMPEQRFVARDERFVAERVRHAAGQITSLLGGEAAVPG